MRAVTLNKAASPLVLNEDHPEPRTDAGEIIGVLGCGVCHSDLHVADGAFGGELPMVLGHEVTGLHAELGPVMVYAPWGCMACRQCDEGLEMICPDATEAGLFVDGGYAEKMWVKDRRYLAPLGGLDPLAAAPLACGGLTAYRAVKHGVERLRSIGDGSRALVIGAGGLGQYAIRYLSLLTDATITAVDTSEDKQTYARSIGASEAGASAQGLAPNDVVLDFIGIQATLSAAVSNVARQGRVIVVGLGGGSIQFQFGVTPHEAHIQSSVWGSRSELDELLELARQEPSLVPPVEVLPLEQAQAAHDRLRAGKVNGRFVLSPARP